MELEVWGSWCGIFFFDFQVYFEVGFVIGVLVVYLVVDNVFVGLEFDLMDVDFLFGGKLQKRCVCCWCVKSSIYQY